MRESAQFGAYTSHIRGLFEKMGLIHD